jgi:hypothetical protein
MGRDGVPAPEQIVPVQVHPQNIQKQRTFFFSYYHSTVRFGLECEGAVITDAPHGQIVVWESDPNREYTTPASGVHSIVTSWR